MGVAAFDAASGADVEVEVEGVFELAKIGTDEIAQGDKLYWDAVQAKLTKTAGTGSKPMVGVATAAARQRCHRRELSPDAHRSDRPGVGAHHQNFRRYGPARRSCRAFLQLDNRTGSR